MGRMVDTPPTVTPGRWRGCRSLRYGVRCDGSQRNRTPLPGPGRSGRHGPGHRRTPTHKGQREPGFRNALGFLDCPHILQHPSTDSGGLVDTLPTGRAAES